MPHQRGAEHSSPSLAIPVFSLLKGEAPFPSPAWGYALLSQKRSLATALITVPGFQEGLLWRPQEQRVRISQKNGKIWLELLVCTLGRKQLHLETPAPQGPCRNKLNVKFLLSKLGLELCVQTHNACGFFFFPFFIILMPKGSRVTCAFSFKDSKVNQILAGKL